MAKKRSSTRLGPKAAKKRLTGARKRQRKADADVKKYEKAVAAAEKRSKCAHGSPGPKKKVRKKKSGAMS